MYHRANEEIEVGYRWNMVNPALDFAHGRNRLSHVFLRRCQWQSVKDCQNLTTPLDAQGLLKGF
jgi:hypothetical protein